MKRPRKATDADLLSFFIQDAGISHADLARATGVPASTISFLASGRRRMNRRHIEVFCRYFCQDPRVFFDLRPR
jgi:hypothetical protein